MRLRDRAALFQLTIRVCVMAAFIYGIPHGWSASSYPWWSGESTKTRSVLLSECIAIRNDSIRENSRIARHQRIVYGLRVVNDLIILNRHCIDRLW